MKLIFCPHCQDVVKLDFEARNCKCGRSGGVYKKDGLHAVISGDAIPLGIDNTSLAWAMKARPECGSLGSTFEAFVIPKECETVEVI